MAGRSHWEEEAEAWSAFARSEAHDHFFWEFNGPLFLDLVPPPGERTLDVACGEGRLGRLLAERGHRVVAIDASRPLAHKAHRAGGQTVVVAFAHRLPLAPRSVDQAVAFMSLQDVDDLDGAVAEVSRALVAGGRFSLAIAHPIRSAGGFDSKEAASPFGLTSYFDSRPWPWTSQHTGLRFTLPGFHRPLEAYTRALEKAGFLIETLREPRPGDEQVAKFREAARWQRIPCFLHVRAVKL